MDHTPLKNELRAFASDSSANTLSRDPVQNAFLQQICRIPVETAKAHPGWSALRVKGETAKWIGEHFRPVLFRNLPFYFEAGINGGWWFSPVKTGMEEAFYPSLLEKEMPAEKLGYYARLKNNCIVCCGPFVDAFHHIPPFTTVLERGFRGVWEEALAAREKCRTQEESDFIDAALAGLEAVHAVQLKYAEQARSLLRDPSLTEDQRKNMQWIAGAASRCPWEPPATFHEGLNTLMFLREILALLDGLYTYSLGHPDRMLRKLYEKDLAEGRLTEEEAYDLISRFLIAYDCHYDGMKKMEARGDHEMEAPLTVGGCDDDGGEIFNDITRAILKAHRENDPVYPKLHCRISPRSCPEYLRTLSEEVLTGRCVYSLFNDDVNISSLLKHGKSLKEPGAEVLTWYCRYNKKIQPGMVRFTNRLGGRVCVMAKTLSDNYSSNILRYTKQKILQAVFGWLRGEPLPAAADCSNIWLLFRRMGRDSFLHDGAGCRWQEGRGDPYGGTVPPCRLSGAGRCRSVAECRRGTQGAGPACFQRGIPEHAHARFPDE